MGVIAGTRETVKTVDGRVSSVPIVWLFETRGLLSPSRLPSPPDDDPTVTVVSLEESPEFDPPKPEAPEPLSPDPKLSETEVAAALSLAAAVTLLTGMTVCVM